MFNVDSFSSAIAGVLGASVITIYFAKKYVQSLDVAVAQIQAIQTKLTEISVKMDLRAEDAKLIHIHDKKLAVLENEIFHGKQKCNSSTGKSKMRTFEDSMGAT